eukprot:4162839-Pleurochrysis_carterae.AAC.4
MAAENWHNITIPHLYSGARNNFRVPLIYGSEVTMGIYVSDSGETRRDCHPSCLKSHVASCWPDYGV